MEKKPHNAVILMEKINEVKSHLKKLECELNDLPGISLIREVYKRNPFSLESDADLLAAIINDRDSPMTLDDVKSVFDASGFVYEEKHVDACQPDSHEVAMEEEKRTKGL